MTTRTEFTGKNVEAATTEAERQLGKTRDQLHIQVLSQGSRGVFGLGGEPARIAVMDVSVPAVAEQPSPSSESPSRPRREPTQAEPPPRGEPLERTREPRPERQRDQEVAPSTFRQRRPPDSAPVRERRPSDSAPIRERRPPDPAPIRERRPPDPALEEGKESASDEEMAAAAHALVSEMLTKMGFDDIDVVISSESDPMTLEINGDNLGMLIGRRGESLAAFQFLCNVVLAKRFRHWPRVSIDVQGYRNRREESLKSLGLRVADRVRKNRRQFTLEAMPANDRRIIHLTLRDRSDVETYSIGEGESRRVVVAPKR